MHPLPSTRRLPILFLALAGLFLALAPAYGYVVIFHDGFTIQGAIKKEQTFIVDKLSGQAFTVPLPGSPYELETFNTAIMFSPSQLHDIVNDPPGNAPPWMTIKLFPPGGTFPMPPSFSYTTGQWDGKWERPVKLVATNKQGQPQQLDDKQRITQLNPQFIRVTAAHRLWSAFYHPDEFGPDLIQKFLEIDFAKNKPENKDLTKLDKLIKISQFLAQCGWLDEAEAVLKNAPAAAQAEKSKIESEQAVLAKVRAMQFVNDLVLASHLGRYKEVQEKLAKYAKDKLDKLVDADTDLRVFEIKDKLAKKQYRLSLAQQLLNPKGLAASAPTAMQPFFQQAAQTIFKEMNVDSVDRLDTFLEQAEVYLLDLKEKRKPALSAEQVLSLAMTGWLLGKNVAEENVDFAKKLWETRDFVLQYQNTANAAVRSGMRQQFTKQIDMDVLARLIQALPPPKPHQKINTDVQQLNFNYGAAGVPGDYLIQLPPEYHHHRACPVLIVLHDQGQTPGDLLKKWSKLAARNGYILVAPEWAMVQKNGDYRYSDEEQIYMMELLRDLRAHFQIDSDRVFLHGLGQGGLMAYDVGMAHPDQFAGVLPMAAFPQFQSWNCRNNGQYLPFYTVSGGLDGVAHIENKKLFTDWVHRRFPALLVEYKGRTAEWFPGEMPRMMDWMNRKMRLFPKQQVGSKGEQFGTMRASDNRFYWVSSKNINPMRFFKANPKWPHNQKPAQISAIIRANNQIQMEGEGFNQISIWLAAGMVDFGKKVDVQYNNLVQNNIVVSPKLEVLMEDFYDRGDRSRLFLDRIDLGK